MDDQTLEQLARRLGARAAEQLDVDATASAVVGRLKADPVRLGWWRRSPRLTIFAAAAVIVMIFGIIVDEDGGNPDVADLNNVPTPVELQALSDDELGEVFDSLSFEAPVSELVAASLDDLSVDQLEELLQTMMED